MNQQSRKKWIGDLFIRIVLENIDTNKLELRIAASDEQIKLKCFKN